jgi:hypothetical protein
MFWEVTATGKELRIRSASSVAMADQAEQLASPASRARK